MLSSHAGAAHASTAAPEAWTLPASRHGKAADARLSNPGDLAVRIDFAVLAAVVDRVVVASLGAAKARRRAGVANGRAAPVVGLAVVRLADVRTDGKAG